MLTRLVLPIAFVSTLSAAGAFAQNDDPEQKLTVHGFLTQAYAKSDGGTVLGITEDGTSDYRSLALQLRYAMSENDTFVLQLSTARSRSHSAAW